VASGEEAITLFVGGTVKCNGLVTDILRGRLTGWDVARRIREEEAAFPVVYVTAYSVEEWTAHGVPNSILIQLSLTSDRLRRRKGWRYESPDEVRWILSCDGRLSSGRKLNAIP